MPKPVVLRPLNNKERETLNKITQSQTAPARQVERAKAILLIDSGMRPVNIPEKLDRTPAAIYCRLRLFNEIGLESLEDQPRAGRPPTYSEEERGQMIQTARTHPHQLERADSHWTLDRLVEYINQELKIGMSRAQLGKVLEAEGLRWYQEETCFTERPDPQFAEKGGHSSVVPSATGEYTCRLRGRDGTGGCENIPEPALVTPGVLSKGKGRLW